jgi:class 3 adenylate cyclase
MAEGRVRRHLAAILAADVVGYSALMEKDEVGTFDRLRAHRKQLFEPQIKACHGHIFKLLGDGLLAEFASVVDAVQCAITLQREMARRNSEGKDGERIDIRISVNLGDVIIEGKDRYGDGINIAARLQELAEPGGIAVSGWAYDHLTGKLDLPIEFVGQLQVKNIERPVRVYRLKVEGMPSRRKPVRAWWWQISISVALVLAIAIALGGYWLCCMPITVSGYVGGSKVNLLAEPEVTALLRDKYGIVVEYTPLGGLEQFGALRGQYDFLWPGTELGVEDYKASHGGQAKYDSELLSPIVFYSWEPVIQGLRSAGLIEKREDGAYYVDMQRFGPVLLDRKTPWPHVDEGGPIVALASDPTESNSGQVFAAMLARIRQEQRGGRFEEVLPDIKAYFDSLGFKSPLTTDLFKQCFAKECPIFVGYESLLSDFVDHQKLKCKDLKSIRVIYPVPTVWATHPLIAANPRGEKLLAALRDPEVQNVAVQKHGFRSVLGQAHPGSCIPTAGSIKAMQLPTKAEMDRLENFLKND